MKLALLNLVGSCHVYFKRPLLRALRILTLMGVTFGFWLGAPVHARAQHVENSKARTETSANFSPSEKKRLLGKKDVKRPLSSSGNGQKWIGGLAYQVLKGKPLELLASLKDETLLCQMIVYCHQARILSDEGGQLRLRVKQAKGPISVQYTLLIAWDIPRQRALFWLDTRDPHDVDDIWGYFRLASFTPGHSLVSFGVAIELPFAVRLLAKPVQRAALSMPKKWRAFQAIEPRKVK